MLDEIALSFTIVAIAGSGIVAGIFFAFSTFVMRALGDVPEAEGMRAMQRINVTVINPFFMLFFLGTPAVSVYLFIDSVIDTSQPGAGYIMTGSALHVVGTFLVTAVFNVPRNNALEKLDADSDEGKALWSKYLREWTMWNHVRTTAALGATVLLSLGVLWS